MDFYELVRGPLAWVALSTFVVGMVYQISLMQLTGKKEPVLEPWKTRKDAIRSILHGLIPFGSLTMRRRPLFTLVTFLFHLSVVILPIFLLAHTVLLYESWRVQWWSLPDILADTMTVGVILACIFFLVRRIFVLEVRQVTHSIDMVLLILILLTFLAGLMSNHQWGPYRPILILHILLGEILLVFLPFSKLRHMLFFLFSRAHLGAEYGKVLDIRDW